VSTASVALTTPKPQAQLLGYNPPLFLANWQCVPWCFGRWLHSTHARPPVVCPFSNCLASSCLGGESGHASSFASLGHTCSVRYYYKIVAQYMRFQSLTYYCTLIEFPTGKIPYHSKYSTTVLPCLLPRSALSLRRSLVQTQHNCHFRVKFESNLTLSDIQFKQIMDT
jgi:hypothetical protein